MRFFSFCCHWLPLFNLRQCPTAEQYSPSHFPRLLKILLHSKQSLKIRVKEVARSYNQAPQLQVPFCWLLSFTEQGFREQEQERQIVSDLTRLVRRMTNSAWARTCLECVTPPGSLSTRGTGLGGLSGCCLDGKIHDKECNESSLKTLFLVSSWESHRMLSYLLRLHSAALGEL